MYLTPAALTALPEIATARDAVHAARVANNAERRRLLSVGASFPERQALIVKANELARQARALREAHWAAIDAAYPPASV